jgi:beta-N-acetylhexosaminidase
MPEGGGPDIRDPIGQLFMVDFTGPTPSGEIERQILDQGIGGVILFDKNIVAPRQIASLTNALQEIAAAGGHPPLVVGADQEGGPVVRLRTGATHFPSATAFGAARSEALAASAAGITARELRAVGIHMNMAPDLDVNSNPANPVIGVRSYGGDPGLVTRLGTAALRAMQASGVAAAVKHFPGHGDTAVDSHVGLPVVAKTRRQLDAMELAPFRAAIRAGAAAVLTAHVVYPALDPDRPATLSARIIGLLRQELGFTGVIVTDSMAMRAITDRYPPGEAAVEAILAGVDLILALGSIDAQRAAIDAVRRAVHSGQISGDRIKASAERILALKRRLGLVDRVSVPLDGVDALVGTAAHLTVADRVAESAVTLVRPGLGIPLPAGSIAVVAEDRFGETAARLVQALQAAGRDAVAVFPDSLPQAGSTGAFVILSGPERGAPAADSANQRGAGDRPARGIGIIRRLGPAVVFSTGTPYDLADVPDGVPCLAVYGSDPPSLRAGARVLCGALAPRGTLPVTLLEPGKAPSEPGGEP